MTSLYEQFLEAMNILSEEEFNEVMETFPNIDVDFSSIYINPDVDQDELAYAIFDEVIKQWDDVYVGATDLKLKEIELWDVCSLQDLKEIQETFPLWTISNYDEVVEQIHKTEEEEKELLSKAHKEELLNCLKQLSEEELSKIVKNYVVKK